MAQVKLLNLTFCTSYSIWCLPQYSWLYLLPNLSKQHFEIGFGKRSGREGAKRKKTSAFLSSHQVQVNIGLIGQSTGVVYVGYNQRIVSFPHTYLLVEMDKGSFTICRATPIAKVPVIAKLFIIVGTRTKVTTVSSVNQYICRQSSYLYFFSIDRS